MFKLMKLELKKFRIGARGVVIANLVILVSVVLTIFASENNYDFPLRDFNNVFSFTNIIVRAVFIIFAAVMIAKLIISEYKNRTINVMFMYPIKRRKIMLAKLFIVVIFTFVSMVLSNLFLDFSLYILNLFLNFIKEPLTISILMNNSINVILNSLVYSFLGLIPLYFGMRKKSGTATIISGVILVSVLNSGTSNLSLSSFIIVPIIGAIFGVGCSYMSIKDIEDVDVIS
jgi:ABC-type transport system involved in multi-copper enzyme maturation permease subunit